MGFFKPIIVTGGGSTIELADNLTTTAKGMALDASQGKLLLDNIEVIDRNMEQNYAKKTDIPKYKIINGQNLPLHIELVNVDTETSLGLLKMENGVIRSTFELKASVRYRLKISGTSSEILFFSPIYNPMFEIGCGISSLGNTMTIPLIVKKSFSGNYSFGYIYAFIKE